MMLSLFISVLCFILFCVLFAANTILLGFMFFYMFCHSLQANFEMVYTQHKMIAYCELDVADCHHLSPQLVRNNVHYLSLFSVINVQRLTLRLSILYNIFSCGNHIPCVSSCPMFHSSGCYSFVYQVNQMLTFLRGAIVKYITDFQSPFVRYIDHFSKPW